MSWSAAIYCAFPDKSAAISFGRVLGLDIPEDGGLPSGNHNFALQEIPPPWDESPVVDGDGHVLTPGTRAPGFWVMGRINTAWSGTAEALAAIEAAGVQRFPADPGTVFAGEN